MWTCSHCGEKNVDDALVCSLCGEWADSAHTGNTGQTSEATTEQEEHPHQTPLGFATPIDEPAANAPFALEPGEAILWQGETNIRQYFLTRILGAIGYLGLLCGAMILFLSKFADTPNPGAPQHDIALMHSFVRTFPIGMWFISSLLVVGVGIDEARSIRYYITNRRAVRIRVSSMSSSRGKITHIDIPRSSFAAARLRDFGNGFGTIKTGQRGDFAAFHCIPDARAVYQAMQSGETTVAQAQFPTSTGSFKENMEAAKSRSPLSVLPFVVFGVLGLAVVIKGAVETPGYIKERNDYHRALGCTTSGVPDASLPPCTVTQMSVDSMISESGGRRSSTDYYLRLRDSTGKILEVPLLGHTLYDTLSQHDRVTVKMWKGKARRLTAHGITVMTADHPDPWPESGETTIVAGLILIAVSGVLVKLSKNTTVKSKRE